MPMHSLILEHHLSTRIPLFSPFRFFVPLHTLQGIVRGKCTLKSHACIFRVCIVNNLGTVLLDKHVRPSERVTDFRTKYSGIRPGDLKDAESLEDVAAEVAKLVDGRILVGHAITNDLQVSPIAPVSDAY